MGVGVGVGTASPKGVLSPVMKLVLIAFPEVASYSPIVLPSLFVTKRLLPDNAIPKGPFSPVMKLAWIAAPEVASPGRAT